MQKAEPKRDRQIFQQTVFLVADSFATRQPDAVMILIKQDGTAVSRRQVRRKIDQQNRIIRCPQSRVARRLCLFRRDPALLLHHREHQVAAFPGLRGATARARP